MNEVLKAIKSRRSIRKYSPDQIRDESLELILEAGIYAPTACNEQPWHFTVIQNAGTLRHINDKVSELMAMSEEDWVRNMGMNPSFQVTYDAPTLIIVSGRKDATAMEADCAAAIQNMLIAAESLDIGSVWLGLVRSLFNDKEEMDKLSIPEGYEPYYGVAFGYKAESKSPAAPKRNMNVVNYIR